MIKTLVKTLQKALSSFFHIKLFTILRSKIHRKKFLSTLPMKYPLLSMALRFFERVKVPSLGIFFFTSLQVMYYSAHNIYFGFNKYTSD